MGRLGSSWEGFWGSTLNPDDADALLGPFAQSPLVAGIFLLVVALALSLSTRPWVPAHTVSNGNVRALHSVYGKLPLSFTHNKSQTYKHVRDNAQDQGSSFYLMMRKIVLALAKGKREHMLDLRLLGARSNVSLERGPPLRKRSVTR